MLTIKGESWKKKKKKMGLLFLGSGTPTFWLGLLLFIKRESRTPTFKILVRTLDTGTAAIALTWTEPPFPPVMWSVYECTLGNEPRTINFLEGWYRCIQSILGQAPPDIWKCLEFLQGEQSNTDMSKQVLLWDESVGKKSGKSVSPEKRVRTIVYEFETLIDNGHTSS